MKTSYTLIALLLLQGLLTGCFVFPHKELVTPPAGGQILDSENHQPLFQAEVVRRITYFNNNKPHKLVTTFSDNLGNFEFEKDEDLRWFYLDYGPSPVFYKITADGYVPFETNRFGWAPLGGSRASHNLGIILLERISNQPITNH